MKEASVIALTFMVFWGLTVSELEAKSSPSQSEKSAILPRHRKKNQGLPSDKDSAAVKPFVDNLGSPHLMTKFPESPLRKIRHTEMDQHPNAKSPGSLRLGNPRIALASRNCQQRNPSDQNRVRYEYETQQKPYFFSHKYSSPPDSREDLYKKPLGGPQLLDPKDIN